ncbi:catalase-like [Leguminivora glycinivorella]|uniref:catalase-like n=1 Tax=Leguminivora glycinivorella TaxID=1035111 RepID=UPI00200E9C02|nr:catalase-like [Leguminivora glycinivorella]
MTKNNGRISKRPIGWWRTSAGSLVEVRDSVTLNTDIFRSQYFWDEQSSADHERVPERVVHALGIAARGYFQVTNDVSKYTRADVFNGIGKTTEIHVRFSRQSQNRGGADLVREAGGMAIKFYTDDGNLDMLCRSPPMFPYRAAGDFTKVAHVGERNPKTNLMDPNLLLDLLTRMTDPLNEFLYLQSDYGLQNGYRKMDAHAIQTYEIKNKHGDRYFARFHYITEQGLELLTNEAARVLRSKDADYGTRDLYNAIAVGDYPSWRLDMDVMPIHRAEKLDYNPFDVTRTWKNGTYHTVTIGRLVLNRNLDNWFTQAEEAIYNPGNLVPGIPGPVDDMFQARRFAYRDTQTHRAGINHNRIEINQPKYRPKNYDRDGTPPSLDNMKGAPHYYPNSFHGPIPHVDETRPREKIKIYDRNAVDLEPLSEFYNTRVTTEDHRRRMAANIAELLVQCVELVQKNFLRLLYLVDQDLGHRTEHALEVARKEAVKRRPQLFVASPHPRILDIHENRCPARH